MGGQKERNAFDRQQRQTDREGIEIIEALLLFCQRMLSKVKIRGSFVRASGDIIFTRYCGGRWTRDTQSVLR